MPTTQIIPIPHHDEALIELHLAPSVHQAPAKETIMIMSPGHHSSHDKGHRQCLKAIMEADIPGYQFIHAKITAGGVAKARNIIAAHAIANKCAGILCWDSDIALPGSTPAEWIACVVRLLSHDRKLGNMAGLYAAKDESRGRWILTPEMGVRRQKNGLLKVFEAGTGLKLIWMWQILEVINKHPDLHYTPDDFPQRVSMWDLFSMGVVNGRYLSEDYYFDYRLRQMGFDVWVDTQIITKHRGETNDGRVVDFPLCPLALPGMPAEEPPGKDTLPRYLDYDPFLFASAPSDLQGWNSDAPIFGKLIEQIHPSVIIEVGSWKGASAIHMAGLCDAMIYCCDTWLGGIDQQQAGLMPNVLGALWMMFCANIKATGYTDRVIPIPQTSLNAARWLLAKGVTSSFIYIDASHEFTDVVADLIAFWKLLTPGGAMLVDDYGDQNNLGVKRAVDWFCAREKIKINLEPSGHVWFIKEP